MCSQLPELLRMDLNGNPVCQQPKYRDRLITVCKTMGKKVSHAVYVRMLINATHVCRNMLLIIKCERLFVKTMF